ncbi:MAG: hypothetical protein NTV38_13300 [Chloroflexi bacterium]|nr:hypothetical protein [Chloroflexota bacterium]
MTKPAVVPVPARGGTVRIISYQDPTSDSNTRALSFAGIFDDELDGEIAIRQRALTGLDYPEHGRVNPAFRLLLPSSFCANWRPKVQSNATARLARPYLLVASHPCPLLLPAGARHPVS